MNEKKKEKKKENYVRNVKGIKTNVVSLKNTIEQKDIAINPNDNLNLIKESIPLSQEQIGTNIQKEITSLEREIEITSDKERKKELQEQLNYIKELLKKQLAKDLVISEIDYIINQITKTDNIKEQNEFKEKIRIIIRIYNEKNLKNAFEILNITKLDDIYEQDKDLKAIKDYKAFVYYFWNPKQMNFRTIGLTEIYPLFEIIETQELFFLDKPTLNTSGLPIFWINKGNPLSQEIEFTQDYENMANKFTAKGLNSSQIDAMTKTPIFLRIFGIQKWTFRTFAFVLMLLLIEGLIMYIIFSSIFGVK